MIWRVNAFGLINIVSLLFLVFVVAFVVSLNENDKIARIFSETLRRALKLLAGLLIIALIVLILTVLD